MKSILALAGLVDPNTVTLKEAGKLKEGHIAVGKMSDDLKRLYGVYGASVDKVNDLITRLKGKQEAHDKVHEDKQACAQGCAEYQTEMLGLVKELRALEKEHEQFDDIFWAATRLEFPELLGKGNITICEDFTVSYDPKSKKSLFGGVEIIGGIPEELQGLGLEEMLGEILMGGDGPFSRRRRGPFGGR